MAANRYVHKPQLAQTLRASHALLAEWKGMEPYPGHDWPHWRHWGHLYTWTCGSNLSHWYMAQDIWTSLAFVFYLLKHNVCNTAALAKTLAAAVRHLLLPFIGIESESSASLVPSQTITLSTSHAAPDVPCTVLATSGSSLTIPHTACTSRAALVAPCTMLAASGSSSAAPHASRASICLNTTCAQSWFFHWP